MAKFDDNDAILVAFGRSAMGRAFKGSLTEVRPDDLASGIALQVLEQVAELPLTELEDFYLGCAEPHREHGFNMGRRVAVQMGLDDLPSSTINRLCASSIQGIRMAFHGIRAGEGNAYLVGGVEVVSRYGEVDWAENPLFANSKTRSQAHFEAHSRWEDPRSLGELPDYYIGMGHTAENVAQIAGISRADQDDFALRSQQLAAQSIAAGHFSQEIMPVALPNGDSFAADDCPRPNTTDEGLAALEPVFMAGGTVTAGNACPMSDGASASVIVSGATAKKYGLEPLARIVSSGVTGLSPEIMGLGPVESTKVALHRASLDIRDMGIVELNEAFASQVLASARALNIDVDKQLNPFGGAIALGHPYGATGVRLVGTLARGLRERNQQYGLATLCVGGGQGMAMVIENLD